jgi:hypothetical protein
MLPKIEHPIYKIKIPSLKKDHSFRPFLVKEEKLLLMALEAHDSIHMTTILQHMSRQLKTIRLSMYGSLHAI